MELTPTLRAGKRLSSYKQGFTLLDEEGNYFLPHLTGFTLVEVVVALAIIATSLLLLLTTIRQGLSRLEVCRSEFQSCLSMQTVVSAFSCGISPPSEENNWVAEESEPRPGLNIVRLQRGSGEGARVWASKLLLEEPAAE